MIKNKLRFFFENNFKKMWHFIWILSKKPHSSQSNTSRKTNSTLSSLQRDNKTLQKTSPLLSFDFLTWQRREDTLIQLFIIEKYQNTFPFLHIAPLTHWNLSSRPQKKPKAMGKNSKRERDGEKEKPGCQSSAEGRKWRNFNCIGNWKKNENCAPFFLLSTLSSKARLCFGSTEVVELQKVFLPTRTLGLRAAIYMWTNTKKKDLSWCK